MIDFSRFLITGWIAIVWVYLGILSSICLKYSLIVLSAIEWNFSASNLLATLISKIVYRCLIELIILSLPWTATNDLSAFCNILNGIDRLEDTHFSAINLMTLTRVAFLVKNDILTINCLFATEYSNCIGDCTLLWIVLIPIYSCCSRNAKYAAYQGFTSFIPFAQN